MADNPDKLAPEINPPLSYGAGATGAAPGDRGADVVRWLFPAYIFVILIGFFALRGPGVNPGGNTLNPDRAIFTAVNATTLTGFQFTMSPGAFFVAGQVIVLVLTILGTLFSLIVGGMAVKRILRLAWPDSRLVTAALVIEVFVILIGGIAAPPGKLLGGIMLTVAAWGNCGLQLDVAPVATDLFTHVVLLPLSVFGGLGLVVLLQIVDYLAHRTPLLRHTKVAIQMTAALFLIGLVGCILLQVMNLDAPGWRQQPESWFAALRRMLPKILSTASVTSVNARTAGMNLVSVSYFPRSMSFFVILLMMIGASPGGTGGGLKTTTVWELLTAPSRLLRGQASRTMGIAATWLGTYLIALAFFHTMLLWAEPQLPPDRVLFVTVSALSNVGLSHDVISMTRTSVLLLSAAMFVGRLAPLLILWWMADTTRDAELAVA